MRAFGNIHFQTGYAIMATTFLMVALSMLGIALLSMVSMGQAMRMEEVSFSKARYAALGGLEWIKQEVDLGISPIVTGKTLGSGTFDIAMDPTTYDMTSTGHSGNANVSFSMHTPVSSECLIIDTSNVQAAGPNITQMHLQRSCLQRITITHIQVTWSPDNGEGLREIQLNGTDIYNNNPGVPSGTNVDVTDYTLSNSSNIPVNHFKFSGNLSGTNMTFVWTFQDTTQQITSVFIPN